MAKQSIFVGDIFETKNNGIVTVVEYINSGNIKVMFHDTGHIASVIGTKLRTGFIKDRTRKSIYGIGYLGEGKFNASNSKKAFKNFQNMYQRCYSDTYQKNELRKSYHGSTVSEEWRSFQDFALWHNEHYIEGYCLDKDLIVEGNKVYSPELCCYVPVWLNNLILKNDSRRSKYGIGVEKTKS